MDDDVRTLLDLYPRIFFACHDRHRGHPALTSQQAKILDHLDDPRPTMLKDLAEHLGVTPSTMSINVDRLVRLGYVSREPRAEDRRSVAIRLTDAGREVKDAEQVLSPERVRRMLDRLTNPQRKIALEGLALLANAADELGGKS